MNRLNRYRLVLAIYVTTHGFAFTLFEGALAPIDWGLVRRDGSEKNSRCVTAAGRLLHRFRPDVLVLEDTSAMGTRRPQRIANLNASIFELSESRGISISAISRAQVHTAFGHLEVCTRHAIAEAIAKNLPAFENLLPPPRKWWNSEHTRMGMFNAAALALTFFHGLTDGGQLVA
jgi:hypothetical protein